MTLKVGEKYRFYDMDVVEIIDVNKYRNDDDSYSIQYELLLSNGGKMWMEENHLMIMYVNEHLKPLMGEEDEECGRISI